MQLGMVGLGRMGANIVRRLQRADHDCVVYDRDPEKGEALAEEGATPAMSLEDLAAKLDAPRSVWVMVPAAFAGDVVMDVARHLDRHDTVIDGGNSNWNDDIARAEKLAPDGIHYVDIGTSGGVWGLERGYSLMIGGDDVAVERLDPILAAIAPGIEAADRTPGRTGEPSTAEKGYHHCGPPGAGHFVKMVHNGVEYGMMSAIAEGLNVLHHAGIGHGEHDTDAETTPLRDPGAYQYDIDVGEVAEVWRRGTVISSWLVDLTASALTGDPTLESFEGRVSDSGEGRWTVQAGIDIGAPTPVIAAALYERFESRGEGDFAGRVLSAMRKEFGGHDEKQAGS